MSNLKATPILSFVHVSNLHVSRATIYIMNAIMCTCMSLSIPCVQHVPAD